MKLSPKSKLSPKAFDNYYIRITAPLLIIAISVIAYFYPVMNDGYKIVSSTFIIFSIGSIIANDMYLENIKYQTEELKAPIWWIDFRPLSYYIYYQCLIAALALPSAFIIILLFF